MTIKLLAVRAEAATTPACLDAAEAAAHAVKDATIETLHIVVDPEHLVVSSEEVAVQQLRVREEGTAQERETATHAAYEEWLGAHPDADIPLRWKERIGAEEENIDREARLFDVLVLPRPTNMDGGDALHAAFHRIKHPFFLVPSKWSLQPGDSFAEHIVIAWNDTLPCRMAAQGALPWLKAPKDVTILLIAEDRALARSLEDMLAENHIACHVHQAVRNEEYLGDQIIAEAHGLQADLLVMGAYRHNQFVEWLLGGGATRHVLAHFDLPLFLAH